MDGDCGVDDRGLDGLLVDDGLDILVDMVVDMLAYGCGCCGGCVLGLADGAVVFELCLLGGELVLDVGVLAMRDFTVLDVS